MKLRDRVVNWCWGRSLADVAVWCCLGSLFLLAAWLIVAASLDPCTCVRSHTALIWQYNAATKTMIPQPLVICDQEICPVDGDAGR
ncbi:hypothetical protein [Zavarzinia sp.]|uniref:hypothetical protein n=1 Tax=Zavarzinia sp. TaxID=2027920 RepID=UPI003562A918